MPKYTPSYVDVSGFSKALNESIFRNAQLNLRREQLMNQSMDDYLKTYNGKVRPVDANRFNEYYTDFATASKDLMRLNRSGAPSNVLMQASMRHQAAKNRMTSFSDESRKVGELQTYFSKLPKDKIEDTELYQSVFSDLYSLNTEDIKSKYGGFEKVPTVFKLREADFDLKKFNSAIDTQLATIAKAPLKGIPNLDASGKQIYEKEEFEISPGKKITLDIPTKVYSIDINPMFVYSAVKTTGDAFGKGSGWLNKFKNDTYALSQNANDPMAAKDAVDLIKYSKEVFGLADDDKVTGAHLYAAQKARMRTTEPVIVRDYDGLKNSMQIENMLRDEQMDEIRKNALYTSIANAKKSRTQSNINGLLSALVKGGNLGMLGNADFQNDINEAFGTNLDNNYFNELSKNLARFQNQ